MSNSTSPAEQQHKVALLLVASSPYLRGILKFVLETLLWVEVTELESEEKALLFLKNLESFPGMIIYDYTANAYLLEDFVGYLKANSKKVKIVVMTDEIREEGKELLKDLSQLTLIAKNSIPNSLVQQVQTLFQNTSYLNQAEYCRIQIGFLKILDGINKDLYIRIGSDKYVKVFNEQETTNHLDINKYKEKGIEYLYVTRSTALWVIEQIQKQIDVFLKASNFRFILRGATDTPEKRFEQKLLRIDDEVHIDMDFKLSIEKAIENIKGLIQKEKKVQQIIEHLKDKKDGYAFFTQKINLTSIIACALAKKLDWMSQTTVNKLIFSSVLCDLPIAMRPHLMKIRNLKEFEKIKTELSDEDQRFFLGHPKDAATLVKRYFNSAPPDTDIVVYQHHELPDGTGFPNGTRADKLSPVSALFIIANDFAYYFLTEDDPTLDDFILKCQFRYDFVNFRKVVKALESLKK